MNELEKIENLFASLFRQKLQRRFRDLADKKSYC